MNSLPNERLRAKFIAEASSIRNKIFRKIQPKIRQGKPFNGQLLI